MTDYIPHNADGQVHMAYFDVEYQLSFVWDLKSSYIEVCHGGYGEDAFYNLDFVEQGDDPGFWTVGRTRKQFREACGYFLMAFQQECEEELNDAGSDYAIQNAVVERFKFEQAHRDAEQAAKQAQADVEQLKADVLADAGSITVSPEEFVRLQVELLGPGEVVQQLLDLAEKVRDAADAEHYAQTAAAPVSEEHLEQLAQDVKDGKIPVRHIHDLLEGQ